jgi:hypothetical protein
MHTITSESQAREFQAKYMANNVFYKVSGGLGNQLFCLSEAYRLHREFKRKVILDISYIDHAADGIPEWSEFIENQGWAEIVGYNKNQPYLKFDHIVDINSLSEQRIRYSELTTFLGWKFDWNRINAIGLFKEGSNPFVESKAEIIEQTAIHFRGGDYFNSPGIGVLDNEYYVRALHRISLDAKEIVIYTDDESKAKILFSSLLGENNFKISQEFSPLEVLNEMTRSKTLIGSNSTLSWWAGFFASKQMTIMPTPFYLQRNRKENKKKNNQKVVYVNRHKNIFTKYRVLLYWELSHIYEKTKKSVRKILFLSK